MKGATSGEQNRRRALVPAQHSGISFEGFCETAAIVCLAVWLLAIGAAFTLEGYVHLLLLGAVVLAVLRFRRKREPVVSAYAEF